MHCMSGSSSTALSERNAHVTLYDVTTRSRVNLVNPTFEAGPAVIACAKRARNFYYDEFHYIAKQWSWLGGFFFGQGLRTQSPKRRKSNERVVPNLVVNT